MGEEKQKDGGIKKETGEEKQKDGGINKKAVTDKKTRRKKMTLI